jgi:hypothetical protein
MLPHSEHISKLKVFHHTRSPKWKLLMKPIDNRHYR